MFALNDQRENLRLLETPVKITENPGDYEFLEDLKLDHLN